MKTSHKLLKLCFILLILSARPVAAEERMNVLLLIADDLNTWILEKPERYSGKVVAPNLKKLGESGLVFSNAYSASPFCVPSRTSMFSGVSPHKSGVYHNQSNVAGSAPLKKGGVPLRNLFESGLLHVWLWKDHPRMARQGCLG